MDRGRQRPLTVVGAATSAGAYGPGQERAPEYLRAHGLVDALVAQHRRAERGRQPGPEQPTHRPGQEHLPPVRARLSEDLPPQSPNYGASPPGRGRNSLASPVRGALTGTGTAPCRGGIASFDRQPGLLPQQGKLPGHGPSAAGEQARRADHPSRMNPTGRHATRASPNRSIGQRPIRLVDRSVPGPPQALLGVRFKASETFPLLALDI